MVTNLGINAYNLDHKFSVAEGFKEKVHPAVIGHYCNLEILPVLDNIRKGRKCSMTLEELKTSIMASEEVIKNNLLEYIYECKIQNQKD